MRIHTDHNGVYVNAIHTTSELQEDGSVVNVDVKGHLYNVHAGLTCTSLFFQRGGVAEHGLNGITNEALIAVLIDRLKFLDGKFPCDENKRALQHLEEAQVNLEVRTARRITRGVEGKEIA